MGGNMKKKSRRSKRNSSSTCQSDPIVAVALTQTKSILMCFYPMPVKWNHGIALISALGKPRGVTVDLLVLDNNQPDPCVSAIRDYPHEHVGFSCVTIHDYLLCLPYMRHARESGHTVLLGGIWAGLGQDVDAAVDLVCRGDGEGLIDYLVSGDTQVFDSRCVCEDLNSLPIPDYELFRNLEFTRPLPVLYGKYTLPYVSSRGCPYSCVFCQVALQHPRYPRIRARVAEDLGYLVDTYHPDIFVLADALIPYYNATWRDSWSGFTHKFVCYIRGDITPWELSWLVSRGMVGCAFGVESGDEVFRNSVLGKGLMDVDLFRTVRLLNDLGVEYIPFYMHGAPGGNYLEATKTFKMYHGLGGFPVSWEYEDLTRNQGV